MISQYRKYSLNTYRLYLLKIWIYFDYLVHELKDLLLYYILNEFTISV